MPKPVKKTRATKRPSSDPMVRVRQQMAEHMEKVGQGKYAKEDKANAPRPVLPVPEPGEPFPSALSGYMAAIGRKGGNVSGAKRMTSLTPEKRQEVALKAAQARWGKPSSQKKR